MKFAPTRSRRHWLKTTLAASALGVLGAPAIVRAQSGPKIRVGYLPIAAGLPFYAAVEKGYFKEAGLDVEPLKFAGAQVFHSAIVIKCGSTRHVLDEGHSVGAARLGTFDQQAIKGLAACFGQFDPIRHRRAPAWKSSNGSRCSSGPLTPTPKIAWFRPRRGASQILWKNPHR